MIRRLVQVTTVYFDCLRLNDPAILERIANRLANHRITVDSLSLHADVSFNHSI